MIKEEKKEMVDKLKKIIEQYPTIGFIDMYKTPAMQVQQIKKQLRDKVIIKVVKKSTLIFTLEAMGKEKFKEFIEFIPKQPAIVFTKMGAFKFYKMINDMRFPLYAREGDVAQTDIKISAGPTSLMPGPVIGEFQRVGLPVSIEEGKITIKKDVVVARKGDKISKELASVLRKLNIRPLEITLNVVAIYENDIIYGKEVLNMVIEFQNKLIEGYTQALNLSVSISYPTKQNIKYLLAKAYQNAKMIEKLGGMK